VSLSVCSCCSMEREMHWKASTRRRLDRRVRSRLCRAAGLRVQRPGHWHQLLWMSQLPLCLIGWHMLGILC
jgi:hypothetical protein